MIRKTLKWFLPVVLAGFFVAGPAAFAQGELGPRPAANRVDRRQDRRALRRESRQIVRRQQKLHADVRQFGPNSTRARIDRRQLRHTRHRYVRQARDLRHDRRQSLRR